MATLRIRKVLAAAAIGASAVTAVAAPAMAEREFVGGGTWDYGTAGLGTILYSNYYHPSNNHRSSVSVNDIVTRSPCTSPGDWSHAQDWKAVSGNKVFWNNAC